MLRVKRLTTLEQAINIGLTGNGNVQVAKTNIELQEQGKKAAYQFRQNRLWGSIWSVQ